MQKRWIPVMTAIALILGSSPVSASDAANGNTVTDALPAGDTTVTGKVEDAEHGDVTYIISIPDKVDFGTLSQPESNAASPVERTAAISASEINGLNTGTSRVAVLLKDSAADGGFKLIGQDSANSGKELEYSIYTVAGNTETNVTSQNKYPNGYLIVLFQETGNKIDLKLKLDQNQLYGQELSGWVGNYKGTLNFYSTVGSIGSFN